MEENHAAPLIPFTPRQIGTVTINTVNARDLHKRLHVRQRFNDWIVRRIKQKQLIEDTDYIRSSFMPSGYIRPIIEYSLTEHAARLLELSERNRPYAESRFLYAIRHGNTHHIKIGMANNAHFRLESLQAGNPIPLAFFGLWEVADARKVERFLHKLFQGSRTLGEWFFLSDQQEQALLDVMQEYKRIG